MTSPTHISRRISDLMACLARYPEWRGFSESLGRLWSMVGTIIDENNALRRRNERLERRLKAHLGIVLELQAERDEAQKAARVAQAMAVHWRLKANPESANYDERREDLPDAPSLPGTHGHNWDADGREVAS